MLTHVPTEFEATNTTSKDSAGNGYRTRLLEEGGGGHGDHGDHGDDHDDHGDDHGDHDDDLCHNTETHENYDATEEECATAGHMWMGDDDHDDHDMCHNTQTHENYDATEEDCANAGHVWMDNEDNHDLPEIHADRVVHTLSFPEHMVCYDMSTHTINQTFDNEAECEAANMMWTAADSGTSDDDHDDTTQIEEELWHAFPNGFVVILTSRKPREWAGISLFQHAQLEHAGRWGEDGTLDLRGSFYDDHDTTTTQ